LRELGNLLGFAGGRTREYGLSFLHHSFSVMHFLAKTISYKYEFEHIVKALSKLLLVTKPTSGIKRVQLRNLDKNLRGKAIKYTNLVYLKNCFWCLLVV